jgi:predicted nucleic acid-binding protein
MSGVTLDAGALIALDRNDRRVIVLLARAVETNSRVTIPASALAQAIRQLQQGLDPSDSHVRHSIEPQRQARLSKLIRQPTSDVVSLDRVDAVSVGRLLGVSKTADVVDAHVVVCARRSGQRVLTSDPGDLSVLDPTLELLVV